MRQIEWVLRVAMFGEFLGHGVFAYQAVPHFQWLLSKSLDVPVHTAAAMLPVIGVIDFVVAGLALVKPVRAVLLYAVVWGFLTALARPLAGGEIWDFVERWPNWGVPLALLYVRGVPAAARDWLR